MPTDADVRQGYRGLFDRSWLYFCRTFKLSDERAWRGACCSEHDPWQACSFAVAPGSAQYGLGFWLQRYSYADVLNKHYGFKIPTKKQMIFSVVFGHAYTLTKAVVTEKIEITIHALLVWTNWNAQQTRKPIKKPKTNPNKSESMRDSFKLVFIILPNV